MWLHNYLEARADMAKDGSEGPKSSFECVFKWSTFSGIRTGILSGASKFLEKINTGYLDKFKRLPENVLTRAMMVCGLVIGPIAPIPILIADGLTLIALGLIFAGGWIAGGAASIILAGLGWIVGGSSAASSIFETGTRVTEDIMFFVLNLLRIPAGLINLCGLVPSFILETISECINYGCLTAMEGCYTCKLSSTNTSSAPPPAADVEAPPPSPVPSKTVQSNVNSQLLEPKSDAMLNSYQAATQAQEAGAGDALEDVLNKTLPPPKAQLATI